MTITLDAHAIGRQLADVILGIREDGTIAVLVRMYHHSFGNVMYLDIVTGYTAEGTDYPTLIRPGDKAQFSNTNSKVIDTARYSGVTFNGRILKFRCSQGYEYDCIRPLPAPAVEPEPEPDTATLFQEISEKLSQMDGEEIERLFKESLSKAQEEGRALRAARKPSLQEAWARAEQEYPDQDYAQASYVRGWKANEVLADISAKLDVITAAVTVPEAGFACPDSVAYLLSEEDKMKALDLAKRMASTFHSRAELNITFDGRNLYARMLEICRQAAEMFPEA